MPTFYRFTENGVPYSFDDIFLAADSFRYGNLWVWGTNISGQHGVNDIQVRSTPITTLAGGPQWKTADCAWSHVAAIKTDGTLWTWGEAANGRLGINATTDTSTPVTTFAGGNNWRVVSCGANTTSAIKTDGTLWTWGLNTNSQLGVNDATQRLTPVTTFAGGNNWKSISGGNGFQAAIKNDGSLWTWGNNSYGQLGIGSTVDKSTPVTVFGGGNDWSSVSCGNGFFGAIKTDGSLWVCGINTNGPVLGTNDTISKLTPVTTFVGGTNWKQVSCGSGHISAIKLDGTLWIWGFGSYGRLGVNDGNPRSTPITTFVGGTNWKQVSAGAQCITAVKTDGTLWVWGRNDDARLGINVAGNRSTPVTTFIGGIKWRQTFAGAQGASTTSSIAIALTFDDTLI